MQTIAKVDALIDSGNGDAGRLYHILEFLKNKKPLYHSDQVYLENKLNSSFSVEDEPELEIENVLLSKVKDLIDSGIGDPGRLQYIYDALANNKSLYHSDSVYLESKLNSTIIEDSVDSVLSKPTPNIIPPKPQKIVPETKIPAKVKGSMPKGWSSENKPAELEKLLKIFLMKNKKLKPRKKLMKKLIYNVLICHN